MKIRDKRITTYKNITVISVCRVPVLYIHDVSFAATDTVGHRKIFISCESFTILDSINDRVYERQ